LRVDFKTTAGWIAGACGGSVEAGRPETVIRTITTDSRDLGGDDFFIPLKGENFDGHKFIDGLAEKKAIAGFLTSDAKYVSSAQRNGLTAVVCGDTLGAFGAVASRHRDAVNPLVIGITGTNGKTTTKELAWSMLNVKFKSLRNEKNYNNEVGVPYTLLCLKQEHRAAVIEMGMNHAGEIDRLSSMTKPDMAVITNVGEGHLEFLGTVENVAMAKAEIMNGMKSGSPVFVNSDTACTDIIMKKAGDTGMKVITFGITEWSDVHPESYRLSGGSIEIEMGGEKYSAGLYGLHNVYNLIAAAALARECGLTGDEIREGLRHFAGVGMRSEIIDSGFIVVNDTYNSNPLSARYALKSVKSVFNGRRKIAVLSDMRELGAGSKGYHRELGRDVVSNGFDLLYSCGEMSENIAAGAIEAGMQSGKALFYRDKQEMISHLKKILGANDVVLVKGSRAMKMEEVVDAIVR
jgi:UDP-N-acetylmuramoyl-tripeptide--D-alanyl-D-alanine ligase